jgi:hypothetical protein
MKPPRFLSYFVALLAIFTLAAAHATDLAITAGSLIPSTSAVMRDGVAGVAITAGQLVYKDTADNKLKLADANGASALIRTPIGLASNTAGIGQNVRYIISDPDLTIGGTVSNGAAYVLSATAGGVAPIADLTTGWYPCLVAIGISATKVSFRATGFRSLTAL